MSASIKQLLEALPPETDGALLLSQVNRLYYTGFSAEDGLLLLTKAGSAFFTDSRYLEAAAQCIQAMPVLDVSKFAQELARLAPRSLSLEARRVSLARHKELCEKYSDVHFHGDGTLDDAIDAQRIIKQPRELAMIRTAQCIAQAGFDWILGEICPGKTEKELALALEYYMLTQGADALSFPTIFVSGKNSSLPHGVPSQKKLEAGDMITMDFGAVKEGYHSDMTRTVILGAASRKQKTVYQTVLAAQEAALACVAPGAENSAVDFAARDVIERAGYGEFFGHGTGHGVGLEIHENPGVSPKNKTQLQTGNVITIEPGIYLPGEFGVRIEDMAAVTGSGYENLTSSPKQLICL